MDRVAHVWFIIFRAFVQLHLTQSHNTSLSTHGKGHFSSAATHTHIHTLTNANTHIHTLTPAPHPGPAKANCHGNSLLKGTRVSWKLEVLF